MNARYLVLAAILGAPPVALADGIDRSGQLITALFENGGYAEFSFGAVSPDVSGLGGLLTPGASSGDLTPSYYQLGAAKADINDQLSYAIIYDQPFGADVEYPAGTGYFAQGSRAEFTSHALTGLLRYKLANNFSFHGGLRLQSIEASARIPVVSGYSLDSDRNWGVGYVAGVAYERPDSALRISLTYNSKIDYDVNINESSLALGSSASETSVDTPQSVNLGRRLNDTRSIAATVDYEKSRDYFRTNLGPTDRRKSIGLAATFTRDNMEITTGIRYINIGDAETVAGPAAPAGVFRDNDAIALGVKIGYSF